MHQNHYLWATVRPVPVEAGKYGTAMAKDTKEISAGTDKNISQLVGGEALRAALGFRSGEAFRVAVRTGRMPVQLFKIAGRRGWFARANDLWDWHERLSVQGLCPSSDSSGTCKKEDPVDG